ISVLGRDPGPELGGIAEWRPALPVEIPTDGVCEDSVTVRIFRSPFLPHTGQPLRFIVTSSIDLGTVDIALRDPHGRTTYPTEVPRLGAPPWSWWVEVPRPGPGRYTIAIGDGTRIAACDRVVVARNLRDPTDQLPLPLGADRLPVDAHAAIC